MEIIPIFKWMLRNLISDNVKYEEQINAEMGDAKYEDIPEQNNEELDDQSNCDGKEWEGDVFLKLYD